MHEVTCFHCRNVVQIAPGDDHCSACGEDLRGLLDEQVISDYFYQRANELTDAGLTDEALEEVERGLTYHELSELRLLAAILSEETGKYDVMRRHVAAIPVTDSLRSEAEWLLRAHQEKQRALREGAKQVRHSGGKESDSTSIAELLGEQPSPQAEHDGMKMWTRVAAVLIVVILASTWIAARRLSGNSGKPTQAPTVVEHPTASSSNDAGVNTDFQVGSEFVESPGAVSESADTPAIALPTVTPIQSSRRSPGVPEGLVVPATAGEPIADSNPRSVVVLSAAGFDLAKFLRESGNPELAILPMDARLQDDKLVVSGIVYLDRQRRQIVEMLEGVPGVAEASTTDLVVRPKPTYMVQDGDTVWSIMYDVYGDYERVEEFFLLNSELARSPDALSVGVELRIPPAE